MSLASRLTTARLAALARALVVGAGAGCLTLGALGRLAMYGFARLTARPSHWTMGGTATVIFAGAIAGAVAALLFHLVRRRLLPRAPVLPRGLVVGALTLLVYSPGIRPPWPLTFALFAPAFLAYGVLLCRWSPRDDVRTAG